MFAIPSLKDLMERSRQSFRVNLKGTDAWIWPNNVYASAKVMAGLAFELFGFADYTQRQKFAITADGENLDLHGDELGMPRRPAGPSRGFVKIVAAGAFTASAGAVFRRSDQVEYRAINGGSTPGAGDLLIEVIAIADGKASVALAGTSLEIVSGTVGEGLAEVGPDGIAGGTDVEDDETYRARILFRKRNPPHGGTAADYVIWASEVPGVTRVYVDRLWAGVGTVRVYPLMDDLFANGIPDSGHIALIANHIEGLRPAGAAVTVAASEARVVNVTIAGLSPDNGDVRAAVTAELAAAFRRLSRPAGLDAAIGGMPYLASPASFSRSWIWQAVANATGEERHEIVAPVADIDLEAGQMATLGTVTFE